MIKGIYSSAAGMAAQEQKINVIGSNIANSQTDGFKRDAVSLRSFREEMVRRMAGDVPIGTLSTGSAVDSVRTDLTQGGIEPTGKTTDLSISGDGFFAVEQGDGTVQYTRNGAFEIDPQGDLALSSGEKLLGGDGLPVHVGSDAFTVAADGTVTVGGSAAGRIVLYDSQPTGGAVKNSSGFFSIAAPRPAAGTIRQGSLESSNVDVADELTGMMAATRSFQSCQQAFKTAEETVDKLVQAASLKA